MPFALCRAFFLHEGITPRYTFRALLGCDEEVGMSGCPSLPRDPRRPAFLFTPDAPFRCAMRRRAVSVVVLRAPPLQTARFASGAAQRSRTPFRASQSWNSPSMRVSCLLPMHMPTGCALKRSVPVWRASSHGASAGTPRCQRHHQCRRAHRRLSAEIHDLLAPAEQAYVELLDVLTEDPTARRRAW